MRSLTLKVNISLARNALGCSVEVDMNSLLSQSYYGL